MEEVLQNLANLQYIDSRIKEIERLRGDLPEEIADIETDIARAEGLLRKYENDDKELKLENASLELDIQESANLVEKYEKQQMTVRNNREYDAITKEIESQKQRGENAKSRLEEIALLLEELETKKAESKDAVDARKNELAEKQKELEQLEEKTKAEERELEERRAAAAEKLTNRYLRHYDRLRNGYKNGLAVVAMEKGACLGMMLPPQVQNEVKRKNKIVIDENSGRIVVDPSFFLKAREVFEAGS